MELIALGTARKTLVSGSNDQRRMTLYARHLEAFHLVVLTLREHGFRDEIHEGALHLYPTNSRNHFFMLADAFRIAYRLLVRVGETERTLTAQDPLELGMLACILSWFTRVPYTVQVHGDYYSPYWPEGSMVRRLRRLLIPFVLTHARKVRVASERVKQSLVLRGIDEAQLIVLPIRPELGRYLRATSLCPKEGLPFRVFTASRLTPEKHLPLLIRAFGEFHRRHSDTELRIAGEGPLLTTLTTLVTELGLTTSVTFIPWTENLPEEMVAADVFALASLHESYGLVLIEALASGTPVVTTDVGAVGEVVKDGVHGIVVPTHDGVSFASALTHLYEDPILRARMGEAGRALGKKLAIKSEEVYGREWVAAHVVEKDAVY